MYLRQVALIVIMAHIGSFVPAEFASLRFTSTRLSINPFNSKKLNTVQLIKTLNMRHR